MSSQNRMTNRERQGWIIVGAIFVTMFFIWGAINCGAVFFVPVLKHFGWTRARLSVCLLAQARERAGLFDRVAHGLMTAAVEPTCKT
jgi:hypothetical protein